MPRKGENIYKRKDGRWEGRYIKFREGNKTRYGYVYDRTYMGVKQRLSEIKTGQTDKKNENLNSNITIKSISEQWILEKKATLKYSSYIKYRNTLEHYIIPYIGQDYIINVSYDTISGLVVKLLTKAGRGENGLSQKTVADSITVVKSIIKYAAQNKYEIDSSVLDVRLKTKEKPLRVLSKQEQERLVEHLIVNIHDPFCRGVLICLFTGIRIGELCALKWEDISSEEHMINVNKTLQRVQTPNGDRKTAIVISEPKSDCSIRQIPIPDILYNNLDFNEDGSAYVLSDSKYYIEPRTVQNHFKKILSACEIKDVNFHALRHTFATRCIEVGFDIKSLSEILGHANVNITLNRYVHPSISLKKENMNKLSDLFAVK